MVTRVPASRAALTCLVSRKFNNQLRYATQAAVVGKPLRNANFKFLQNLGEVLSRWLFRNFRGSGEMSPTPFPSVLFRYLPRTGLRGTLPNGWTVSRQILGGDSELTL